MQKRSPETSAGLLRWLMAAQTGLLPTQPITAQINLGLSLWLDEKRGSRHVVFSDLHRLGRRFFRASNASTGGSGLGLSIVLATVKAHGGHVQFLRSAQGGLRVELVMPAML